MKIPDGGGPPPLSGAGGESSPGRERAPAAHDLSKTFARLKALRWIYLAGALLTALVLAFLIPEAADPTQELDEVGAGVIVMALALVVDVCAFLLVTGQPLVWSIAITASSVIALGILVAGAIVGKSFHAAIPALAITGAWTALSIWIVAVALRVQRLSRAVPGLRAELSNTRLSRVSRPAGVSMEEWTRRADKIFAGERRRTELRTVMVSVVLLAIVAATFFGFFRMRPQEIDDAVARFVGAWSRQDASAIAAMAQDEKRDGIARRLANVATTRHWESGWPVLTESYRTVDKDSAILRFLKDEAEIQVEWTLEKLRWKVKSIVPPLPEFRGALENFDAAWGTSDAKAVAALFVAESRDKMELALMRHLKKRNWQDKFPEIEFVDARPLGNERIEVKFNCVEGALSVRWKLDPDDNWVLSSIDWPKEN